MRRVWILGFAGLAACASFFAPQHDRSRFYALAVVVDAAATGQSPGDGKTVGVGPVRIPDYLDKNEICTRLTGPELHYSEHSRWASPLRASVPATLAQDLGALLPGSRVVTYPWSVAEPVDLQVEVDVRRFEASADGKATLEARWTVRDAKRKVLLVRDARHTRDVNPRDVAAAVTALSETLGDLARDVAGALPPRSTF